MDRIRNENGHHCRLNVLDLGCGKGGDLLKWERGRVHHVICADIAETSIEQCKDRYAKLKHRSRNVFSAEFIAADCSKVVTISSFIYLQKNNSILVFYRKT